MLETLITVVHILVAISLIFLVLIQDSKGGAMGGLGTGNANSLLGATGATTLASKLTQGAAVLFAVTCISLAVMSSRSKNSVIDNYSTPATTTPAAAPAAPDVKADPQATQQQAAPAATTEPAATAPTDANAKPANDVKK